MAGEHTSHLVSGQRATMKGSSPAWRRLYAAVARSPAVMVRVTIIGSMEVCLFIMLPTYQPGVTDSVELRHPDSGAATDPKGRATEGGAPCEALGELNVARTCVNGAHLLGRCCLLFG